MSIFRRIENLLLIAIIMMVILITFVNQTYAADPYVWEYRFIEEIPHIWDITANNGGIVELSVINNRASWIIGANSKLFTPIEVDNEKWQIDVTVNNKSQSTINTTYYVEYYLVYPNQTAHKFGMVIKRDSGVWRQNAFVYTTASTRSVGSPDKSWYAQNYHRYRLDNGQIMIQTVTGQVGLMTPYLFIETELSPGLYINNSPQTDDNRYTFELHTIILNSGQIDNSTATNYWNELELPTVPIINNIEPGMTTNSIHWGQSSYASGYRLYRDSALIFEGTGTSYGDSGLSSGTTYAYTIQAYNALGDSELSSEYYATTLIDDPGDPDPEPPTDVPIWITVELESRNLYLQWTEINLAEMYQLFENGVLKETIADNEILLLNLDPGTIYKYRVRGINSDGNGPLSEEIEITVPPSGTLYPGDPGYPYEESDPKYGQPVTPSDPDHPGNIVTPPPEGEIVLIDAGNLGITYVDTAQLIGINLRNFMPGFLMFIVFIIIAYSYTSFLKMWKGL